MKSIIKRSIVMLTLCFLIVSANAQYRGGRYHGGEKSMAYRPGSIQITPYMGFMFGDDYDAESGSGSFYGNAEQDDSATYGVRVGFGLVPNVGIEFQFSHADTSFYSTSGSGFFQTKTKLSDVEIYQILGNINFDFSNGPLVPYMALGLGTTIYDFDAGDSDSEFTGTMAGGLKARLAPNIALRFEVRGYVTKVQDTEYYYYYDGYYYDWRAENDAFLTTWDATLGLSFML